MDNFIKSLDEKINRIEILISNKHISTSQKKKLSTRCYYFKNQKQLLTGIFNRKEEELIVR